MLTDYFSDLSGDNQRKAVDHFQKRFSYWVGTKIKVRKGVTFHSLRHLFRDAMANAGLPEDAIRSLGGWARGSSIINHYGQGAQAQTLAGWMERIQYSEVNFASLVSNPA
jgi:integrase